MDMNNSAVNFTTSSKSTELLDSLQMGIYIINLLFGLPAHSYVLYLILTGSGSGIASEFFNLNYSFCETGICLKGLMFVLSRWHHSLSKFDLFLVGLSITGRPLFQCLICVERYLAVIHPVTFLKYKPLRYKLMCCTAAWIVCLGSCVFCMFTVGVHLIVFICYMTVQLLIFLSIQLFCCVAVLRALKQSGPGERGREREEENNMKKRAFQLILITTVTMLMQYGPFALAGFFSFIINPYADIMDIWIFALICFLLAGFVQPVLYLQRTGKISCHCPLKNLLL